MLAELCTDTKIAWQAMGKVNYDRTAAEQGNVKFRRSLYVVKDIAAGETLTAENVRSIRPGFGLAPKHYDVILGKKAKCLIPRGTALTFDVIK